MTRDEENREILIGVSLFLTFVVLFGAVSAIFSVGFQSNIRSH